jgi:ABC-type nitrate/sulfonate/bicarbonate transport system substrate-binding protein
LERPQRAFRYSDYGVPDQHTTFLGGNASWIAANPDTTRAFVQVAQRGYAFADDNPKAAAQMLIEQTDGMLSNPELVHASMQALVEGVYLRDADEPVGLIDDQMFNNIVDFLFAAEILRDENGVVLEERPDSSGWFTNDFLMQ